jgi:hypothetical protein
VLDIGRTVFDSLHDLDLGALISAFQNVDDCDWSRTALLTVPSIIPQIRRHERHGPGSPLERWRIYLRLLSSKTTLDLRLYFQELTVLFLSLNVRYEGFVQLSIDPLGFRKTRIFLDIYDSVQASTTFTYITAGKPTAHVKVCSRCYIKLTTSPVLQHPMSPTQKMWFRRRIQRLYNIIR